MRMICGYIMIVLLDWGIFGAWMAWLMDQNVRALIIYFRFRSGKWKAARV